jgi:type I restriction enzyme S subunit
MRSLGSLLESGVIDAVNGFPFGGHNEDGEGVPHIRPFNVDTNGEIDLDQIKSIPAEAASRRPRLRRGDIVFNNTNTKELVGKCALWNQESDPVFSNHMTRIRVRDGMCDPAYLSFAIHYHWMTGRSEMLARAHVAQASIMGERFREIEIPWRNLSDQRATAEVLAMVRESYRSDLRQQEHAHNLKACAMQELFTRGLGGEPQKDTEIGLVPESWEVCRLGEVCALSTGTTPSTKREDYYRGSTPFIKTAEITNNRLRAATTFVSHEAVADYNLTAYSPGTVLMAMYGQGKTRGQVALLEIAATTTQNAAAIEPSERVHAIFLWHYLMSIYGRLRGMGSLGHLSHLNLGYLRELLVPVPSPDEQRDISAILDAIDRKVNLHQKKRFVLDDLFRSLLHKLMAGDLRVSDLNLSALSSAPEAPA